MLRSVHEVPGLPQGTQDGAAGSLGGLHDRSRQGKEAPPRLAAGCHHLTQPLTHRLTQSLNHRLT